MKKIIRFWLILMLCCSAPARSETSPDYERAWNAGNKALDAEKWTEAITHFDTVISYDPQESNTWSNRGYAHNRAGNFDKAINDFNQAIRLNPRNADAYFWRGMSKKGAGDYQGLVADAEKAAQIDPAYKDHLDDVYSTRNYAGVKWVAAGVVVFMTLIGSLMIWRVVKMFRPAPSTST